MAPSNAEDTSRPNDDQRREPDDTALGDVLELARRMNASLDEKLARADAFAYLGLKAIADEIGALKRELATLGPTGPGNGRFVEAGRELDAVVEATAEASDTIMGCAEAVMAADVADPEAYKALVDDKMIAIFEACAFQDLTSQRIRKVCRTLSWIEERVAALAGHIEGDGPLQAETDDERRRRELMLHGPQAKGEGVSQSAVDDLLATADQDAIDKLFA